MNRLYNPINVTGSLQGTASYSSTSSYLINDQGFVLNSQTSSMSVLSSSYSNVSLQRVYDNSITTELTTNSTLGAVSIKQGSGADTDIVLEVLNNSSTPTFTVNGNGLIGGYAAQQLLAQSIAFSVAL